MELHALAHVRSHCTARADTIWMHSRYQTNYWDGGLHTIRMHSRLRMEV